MTGKRRTVLRTSKPSRGRAAAVPLAEIRRFGRRVAQRFHPDKIILFGSHADGSLHPDSDVDLLVIMPTRNQLDQACRIRLDIPAPFPMDLIVRTPKNLASWIQAGDSFHTQIISQGRVLYEKISPRVGTQG